MHAAYCVGYHWEKGNVKGFVLSCVFAILQGRSPLSTFEYGMCAIWYQ